MPRLLSFAETKKLLDKHALPLVPTTASASRAELFAAFARGGKPVVLKPSGPGVLHKTEKGLVFTGIGSREQLEQAVAKITAGMRGAGEFVFLLQQQLSGAELIIGGKHDACFGPTVLFGTGGVYAELLDDASVRVAPLEENDALEMIRETRARKFLEGFRGTKADGKKIVELLLRTSGLMQKEQSVVELDFNPVIASGESALIVDARIIVE